METTTDCQYYFVLDLEATCDANHAMRREDTEIIEIGAVLCDAKTFEPCGEFQTFVRPIRRPRLTAFCTELTTITQADVANAPPFTAAIAKLEKFVVERQLPGRFVFCSWGDYDKQQLAREAQRNRVRIPLGARHLNLKRLFGERHNHGRELGTRTAMRQVGLVPERTAHRAIDDAYNIAKLLPWCVGNAQGRALHA